MADVTIERIRRIIEREEAEYKALMRMSLAKRKIASYDTGGWRKGLE